MRITRSSFGRRSLGAIAVTLGAAACSSRGQASDAGSAHDPPFGSATAGFSAVTGATVDVSSFRASEVATQATAATTPSEGCLAACNATLPSLAVIATEGARSLTLTMTLYDGAVTSRAVLDSSRLAVLVSESADRWVWDGRSGTPSATVTSGGHVTIALMNLAMVPDGAHGSKNPATFTLDGTVTLNCAADMSMPSYAQCRSADGPALP